MKKCVAFLMVFTLVAAKPVSPFAAAAVVLPLAGLFANEASSVGAITLYEHSDQRGERITKQMAPGICTNINYFIDWASSVKTYDGCFVLWDQYNCRGKPHVVAPGRGCHFNLKDCGFNDITRSVRRC